MKSLIWKIVAVFVVIVLMGSNFGLNPVQANPDEPKTGSVWYVSKSGSNSGGTSWATAFNSLQAALSTAVSGDQIWVAEGVYIPGTERTDSFNLVPGVALYGGFAGTENSVSERDWEAHKTILSGDIDGNDTNTDGNFVAETTDHIQGDNSYHVVFADGTTGTTMTGTTILDGFIITGGDAAYGASVDDGGGMYCDGSGAGSECSPSLKNLTFSGNKANSNGGALFNDGGYDGISSPTLENVIFSGNTAEWCGGANYNQGNDGTSRPALTDVIFVENSAIEGGAMYNNGYYGNSSPTLLNVIFSHNTAFANGGAMENIASNGISSPNLVNVVFWGNSALSGGAINYFEVDGNSTTNLVNVTFFGNTASNIGGAIANDSNITLNLTNVILWGNMATSGSQIGNYGTITFTTSLVQGGITGSGIDNDEFATVTDGGGNLETNPLFVDAVNGDFHLQADSPAVDSGTNAAMSESTDPDDNPRIADGDWDGTAVVDMGAFEYQLSCPGTNVVYVDANSSLSSNGESWDTAYRRLTDGLKAARNCSGITQVWVADGVYVPGMERTDSFNLVPGLALYGGFAGTETALDERDWEAHTTILSGDLAGDDTNDDGNFIAETADHIQGDNSYHVVVADGSTGTPITITTILDGFVITGGDADVFSGGGFFCDAPNSTAQCSPSLRQINFSGNRSSDAGGAMVNHGSQGTSSPHLINVTFSGNSAFNGGALFNEAVLGGISNPVLENVTFFGNSASSRGGAIFNDATNSGTSSPVLINVGFSENSANAGGAMYNNVEAGTSNPNLSNVILWGNTASSGSQLYNDGATITLTTSLVEGGITGTGIVNDGSGEVTDGGGNLDADPMFVDADSGNLRLEAGSPAIDSGLNAVVDQTTDLDGNIRLVDGDADGIITVDMGAYENQSMCPHTSVLYIDKNATSPGFGESWETAYLNLVDGLTAAAACSNVEEIWVAQGVYVPGMARSDSFNLVPGVALYGGFAGTETMREERDWEAFPTILSGDIDGNDLNTDGNFIAETYQDVVGANSYHVVVADGKTGDPITDTTILDGFTITAGQAKGSSLNTFGGGLFCSGSQEGNECSPSVRNSVFSGNSANAGGAIVNFGTDGGKSSPTLQNVLFLGNNASIYGGAIFNYGSSNGNSSPSLQNVSFFENSATLSGGAMFNGGDGGGTSSPALVNVLFWGNSATQKGGALYNSASNGNSSPDLLNVSLAGNTAQDGGAIYNQGDSGTSSPVFTNTIVWGNSAVDHGMQIYNKNATVTLISSLVEGGITGEGIYLDGVSSMVDGGGNIDDDPLFVDVLQGDLHLTADSPAIDSGSNAEVLLLTDLDSYPRIADGDWNGTATVDIGAYEYQFPIKFIYLPLVIR